MWQIKLQKIVGDLWKKFRKLYIHEWNGYREIFSRRQVIENSRQYLVLRTDILQKTVVGCPWFGLWIRHWLIEIYNRTSIKINILYKANKNEIFYYICPLNLQINEKSKIWQNLTSWNQTKQKTVDRSELILKGNYEECTKPRST